MASLFNMLQPLSGWAYLGIAVLVAVEGPIVTLLGAAAAAGGYLKPGLVFISAAAGNMVADNLWYLLGYLGKMEWMVRYGRWFGVRRDQVERLERSIQKHALSILFIAKLTLGFMVPALIATGLAKIPWRRWIGVLALGEFIWTGTLVLAGYFFGQYLKTMEVGLQIVTIIGVVIFLSMIIRFIIGLKSKPTGLSEKAPTP
jgi:membrane protein DedA with SNARE-associated domain